ncbi:lysine/arginine/ornithine transporter subunit [Gammaproteobacteria bacterium]|nr:lysine/arginine/ornithine transporter subunit [Gammaproteobacteria bacterium]
MKKNMLIAAILATMLNNVSAQTILKIGVEGAYPPFSYISAQGKVEGFEPELALLFCEKMQVTCELVQTDFDALIPSLNSKKIDVVIASMSVTDERKKAIDFSDKYYNSPAKFVHLNSMPMVIIDKNDVKGKAIGVQSGTIHETFAQDNYAAIADVKSYRSLDEAMSDLSSGRIQLVFADSVALDDGYMKKDPALAFIGPDFVDPKWFGAGIGAGVRKGDKIVDALNAAIKASRSDGSYQNIAKKYFEFDVFGDK